MWILQIFGNMFLIMLHIRLIHYNYLIVFFYYHVNILYFIYHAFHTEMNYIHILTLENTSSKTYFSIFAIYVYKFILGLRLAKNLKLIYSYMSPYWLNSWMATRVTNNSFILNIFYNYTLHTLFLRQFWKTKLETLFNS